MLNFIEKITLALFSIATTLAASAWLGFCLGVIWSIVHRTFELGSF